MKGGGLSRTRFSGTVYVFAALMICSFSLLLLSTRSFIVNFKNIGLSAFSGVRGGVHEVSSFFSRTMLSVSELANLRREYAELLRRLERYEELERSNAEINQENIRLREQLMFSRTMRYRHIPAEISGRDPDNLFSALVINKGKHSGVANNMAVIAWQNGTQALVGKVIQAGAFESLVMPIYDVSSQAAARFSMSRYEGIVEGQGNPETPLLMRFIPKRALDDLNTGDIIVSSGIGGVFPPGITIGRVSALNFRDYEISIEAEVQPSIDFSRLEYVFVIDAKPEASDG
jgi:rod shape-determining protein MreC